MGLACKSSKGAGLNDAFAIALKRRSPGVAWSRIKTLGQIAIGDRMRILGGRHLSQFSSITRSKPTAFQAVRFSAVLD